MAPMKTIKAKGTKALSKGGLAEALATESGLKKSQVLKVVNGLADIGAQQVKSVGKFTLPGLCLIRSRVKPATKAGTRTMFGKEVKVAAKPARTVLKAFAVSALKKSI